MAGYCCVAELLLQLFIVKLCCSVYMWHNEFIQLYSTLKMLWGRMIQKKYRYRVIQKSLRKNSEIDFFSTPPFNTIKKEKNVEWQYCYLWNSRARDWKRQIRQCTWEILIFECSPTWPHLLISKKLLSTATKQVDLREHKMTRTYLIIQEFVFYMVWKEVNEKIKTHF